MVVFILSWAAAASLLLVAAPFPLSAFILVAATLANAALWLLLVGGFDALREVISAHTQPPLPPPHALTEGTRRMLVIGAARGLGFECAALARRSGWTVHSADASLTGASFVDLTQPRTIEALCEQLATSGVRRLDALLLVAGVCDAAPVRVAGSSFPRMMWVNFLGHAVVVQELEARGIAVDRTVLVSSGAYARGGGSGQFFPALWGPLGAMAAYARSKFLATAWASWLRTRNREVAIVNPGPMRSTIGDAHVPLLLWPSYGLMKEVLFPLPDVAARSVLHAALSPGQPAEYVNIRVPTRLLPESASAATHAWLLDCTRGALKEAGYARANALR